MRKKKNDYGISFSMSGDMIKVELIDTNYNTYLKEKANINNETQMRKLAEKLENHGVVFPKSIVKKIDKFLEIKELEKWL